VSARDVLERAKASGVRVFLRRDGAVQAMPTPPADLLADMRAQKAGIALLLGAEARSPDLPACLVCGGQRFWRDTTGGAVGEWTCARAPIPQAVRDVDILSACRGEPTIVMCCTPGEAADPESFARIIATIGAYVALGQTRARPCQHRRRGKRA
jgi:hypothetical protein